jgi:hypothetical protein
MFALQLDESIDFTDKSHLLAFVRYEHEKYVIEDLLFCKEVIHNTANDVFEALNDFILKNELDWNKCVGLTTDGAGAMAGRKTGLMDGVIQIVPNIK